MSRIIILKGVIVVFIGILLGYVGGFVYKKQNSSNRHLASVTMSKMAAQQFSKTLINIRIKNIEIGQNENDMSTVAVTIKAFGAIPEGIKYSWALFDISLLEGSAEGLLPALSANQDVEFVIKVRGYAKEKKSLIGFSINGEIGKNRIQQEVLASSRPEDAFEYVVQNYEKKKESEGKLFNKLGKNPYKAPIDIKKVIH